MSRRSAAARRPFPFLSFWGGLGALLLALGAAPRAQDCLAPPPNMVVWYPLDETSGSVGQDLSLTGAGSASFVGTTAVPGMVGGARRLVPGDAIIASGDLHVRTNQLTVAAWIKLEPRVPAGQTFLAVAQGSNPHPFQLLFESGPIGGNVNNTLAPNQWQFEYLLTNDSGTRVHNQSTGVIAVADGQYHHYAMSYDGSFVRLYIDGVLRGTFSFSGHLRRVAGEELRVAGGSPFSIDELELYNRALSGAEIQASHAAGSQGRCKVPDVPGCITPSTDIAAWWPFDEADGGLAMDESIAGTAPGAVTGTSPVQGLVGAARRFAGGDLLVADGSGALDPTGNQVTVEGWIRLENRATGAQTFAGNVLKGTSPFFAYGILFESNPALGHAADQWQLEYLLTNSANNRVHNQSTRVNVSVDGAFHHYAMTYDGASVRLYVDGFLRFSTGFSGNLKSEPAGPLQISGLGASTFDELAVHSRALSAAEIQALVQARGAGRCKVVLPTDELAPEIAVVSHLDGQIVGASPQTIRLDVLDESGVGVSSSPSLTWGPSALPAPADGESVATFSLVEGPNPLTITAIDDALNVSSTTLTLILDSLAPVVTIDSPPDGALLSAATAAFAATVADATATHVLAPAAGILTDLPAGGGTVSATVTLAEGENTLVLSAVDAAGNSGSAAVTVTVDTLAPLLAVRAPEQGTVLGAGPVALTLDVLDASATTVGFGGNTVALPAGGGTAVGDVTLVEGDNAIQVSVTDAAGNASELTLDVVLDLSAPLVSIDYPADGAVFGPGASPVSVVATVDDLTATSVTSNPLGVSAALPAGGGVAAGAVALSEGANTLSVSATDATGRTATSSIGLLLDTTAPEIALASPLGGAPVRGIIDFHATAADVAPGTGIARVDFRVDGALVASLTEPPFEIVHDTTALADGPHVFAVETVDGLGNASSASALALVDNTPPVTVFSAPLDGSYVSLSIPVTCAAADDGSGLARLEIRSGSSIRFATTYPTPLASDGHTLLEDTTLGADGPLTFVVVATDAAGNSASSAVTVVVDNTLPEKTLIAPTDGSTVSGALAIVAAAADANLLGLEILADGVSLGTSATSPLVVTLDTLARLDGPLRIQVVATDLAGNTTTCTADVTVDNLDVRIAPETLNLRSKGKQSSVTARVCGASAALLLALDPSAVRLRVPGGAAVPATSVDLEDGGDAASCAIVKLYRQAVIASIRAGLSSGAITDMRQVLLTLVAGPLELELGTDVVRAQE